MKLCRFLYQRNIYWGQIRDETVIALRASPFVKIEAASQRFSLKKIKLLPPTTPTKVILVGLNYKDHARELKMPLPRKPLIFIKPNSSIIGHNASIIYPCGVGRLDYEAELAIVIGKVAKSIRMQAAHKYILGYTCLNDVTARDLQKEDGQWTRSKSFDTFCPLGPWIETGLDPENLEIKLYLNGKLKQSSCTKNFIFSVNYLVSFISRIMTLLPGDVISTGTPAGVGRMQKGDIVELAIAGIGRLRNRVI